MNRSWFNAFEARVNTHVEQGEAVYADIEASYSGNPLERLVNAEDLTPAQTLAALPVFENIPQAINVRIGRRTGDASDQPLFNETFDPRERLALTISRARSGIVGETFGGRARDIFEEES